MIPIIQQASEYSSRAAIKCQGQSYTYQNLLKKSESIAHLLLDGKNDLNEKRVAFIVLPGFDYVAVQWGIWRAGGIAVPLCVKHPYESLKYVIEDIAASALIYHPDFSELISPFHSKDDLRMINSDSIDEITGSLPVIDSARRAMILYTSGTTGSPKGVVSTHDIIEAQIQSLVSAWEWTKEDHILNVLPLHHIHGILNATCTPLRVGACVEFLPKFDTAEVFNAFSAGEVNVFMAVPTIYYKLVASYSSAELSEQELISTALKKFRLMISGSAALPITVLEQWKQISGHTLLERYGMTEIGMAISNPYKGERKPGFIGQALPKVKVRLEMEEGSEEKAGEIQIKGPNVFLEYWGRPEATKETFTDDGWFMTGDVAVFEEGAYRILGRNSVDIIKSGGYKISALEIEEVLRKFDGINDCGVIGLPDDEWGEIIGACIVGEEDSVDMPALNSYLREKLPNYKIPRKYIFKEDLPRNVMGKVTKKELKNWF